MRIATFFEDEPRNWSLRNALKYKAGWTDNLIAEMEISAGLTNRLDLAVGLERQFEIEIHDQN